MRRHINTSYRVRLSSYCGMSSIPEDFDNAYDAREECARRLCRARREGYPIAILERGKSWEIQEPDDSAMVPDDCGTLHLREPDKAECAECGCEFIPEEDRQRYCGEDCARIAFGLPLEEEGEEK